MWQISEWRCMWFWQSVTYEIVNSLDPPFLIQSRQHCSEHTIIDDNYCWWLSSSFLCHTIFPKPGIVVVALDNFWFRDNKTFDSGWFKHRHISVSQTPQLASPHFSLPSGKDSACWHFIWTHCCHTCLGLSINSDSLLTQAYLAIHNVWDTRYKSHDIQSESTDVISCQWETVWINEKPAWTSKWTQEKNEWQRFLWHHY